MNTDDRAADVVRAHELLKFIGGDRAELRDLLRRWIGGLSPEAADAALVDLFREIDICNEVLLEHCGFRKLTAKEIEEQERQNGGRPPF
jgi:hypothetical protein